MTLPTDAKQRKERPIVRGVLDYFPDAVAAIANVSFVGNQQHNPGEAMHWAREKSNDHADCLVRHLLERGTEDDDGLLHSAKMAWRALALLQLELESEEGTKAKGLSSPPPQTEQKTAWLRIDRVSGIPTAHSGHAPDTFTRFSANLRRNGCREDVVRTVMGGISRNFRACLLHGQVCYIAGPMRGKPNFNFPAFDAARDLLHSSGWTTVSPADIDRWAEGKPRTYLPDPTSRPSEANQVYAYRDLQAIQALDPTHGDAIMLLDGWEDSVGARAENALAIWLELDRYRCDGKTLTKLA